MTHTLVVGTSEPQDFQLLDEGLPLDGTSLDIDIEFRETLPVGVTIAVAWLSQATGTVRVTGIEDLPIGKYHSRFKLTDVGNDDGYVPNEQAPDTWDVVKV
jgi:hypothetical protein